MKSANLFLLLFCALFIFSACANEENNITFNWTDSEVTQDLVREALSAINNSEIIKTSDIKNVSLSGEDGKTISLILVPKSTNADSLVGNVGKTLVAYSEELFSNKEVSAVELHVFNDFIDEFGKVSSEVAVTISWDRNVSDKVNYETFKDLAARDYKDVFNISSQYRINPIVYNQLKNPKGLKHFDQKYK